MGGTRFIVWYYELGDKPHCAGSNQPSQPHHQAGVGGGVSATGVAVGKKALTTVSVTVTGVWVMVGGMGVVLGIFAAGVALLRGEP